MIHTPVFRIKSASAIRMTIMSLFPCAALSDSNCDPLACIARVIPSWSRHEDFLSTARISASFVTLHSEPSVCNSIEAVPGSDASTRSAAKSAGGRAGTARPSPSSKKSYCTPLETLHETDADDSCDPTPDGPAPPTRGGTPSSAQTQSPPRR